MHKIIKHISTLFLKNMFYFLTFIKNTETNKFEEIEKLKNHIKNENFRIDKILSSGEYFRKLKTNIVDSKTNVRPLKTFVNDFFIFCSLYFLTPFLFNFGENLFFTIIIFIPLSIYLRSLKDFFYFNE